MLLTAKRVRNFFSIIAVLVIIGLFYVPALQVGYFADDFDFAVRLGGRPPVSELVTRNTDGTMSGGSWRPLTMVSLWTSMSHGLSPKFDHGFSLLLYLVLVTLFFLVIRKLFPEQPIYFSALMTLVFGLMPIHAEPVVWIAARGDLLAAVFGLCALLLWLEGRHWPAIGLFILSLLAKEVWILFGPVLFLFDAEKIQTQRKRIILGGTLLVSIAVWFVVRYIVTHYGVGGYSIRAESHVLGLQHLANELIGFFAGSWTYGEFQSWLVRFLQYYWFISLWLLVAGACLFVWLVRKESRARLIAGSLAATLAPILLLGVPFVRPEASVAEQRYWFAPSIFLVLCFGFFLARQKTRHAFIILVCICIFFGIGLDHNIGIYRGAAVYRDTVLTSWSNVAPDIAAKSTVALLPDSWYGVHLLASPFFERATQHEKLRTPHDVTPWYEWCTSWCLSPATVERVSVGEVHVFTQDPRIFASTSRGLRHDINLATTNDTPMAIWTGVVWTVVPSRGVENTKAR